MVKIKTISRTEEDYVRKSKLDIVKVHRNHDPAVHPFEKAREYTRAVVATKLDKIFAKPFIRALDGHKDGVFCMSTIRSNLVPFISGSCDGEIRVWDMPSKSCVWSVYGHQGFVRGVAPDNTGNTFYSCGDDKLIKRWQLQQSSLGIGGSATIEPVNVIHANTILNSIDHHWIDSQFATCGENVTIWDEITSQPTQSYKWGAESALCVKYNPGEGSLLASTGNDRSICLYDLRASVPMKKLILAMNSNKIAWNPREPTNFCVANEDFNVYSFDMRNLDKALMIHKGHVGAVMDVAFSPTGKEIVSGSYDRTVRLFNVKHGGSRDVYHTKRMQRIFSVAFTSDSQYVLTGSDDTNIRLWKTQASKTVANDTGREERKKQYLESLKRRYAHMPEITRMNKEQRVPKAIKKQKILLKVQRESAQRKLDNRIKHSKEGSIKVRHEQQKPIVQQIE